jgi:hypothetical protein
MEFTTYRSRFHYVLKQDVTFDVSFVVDISSYENAVLVRLVCLQRLVCKSDHACCLEEHAKTVLRWLNPRYRIDLKKQAGQRRLQSGEVVLRQIRTTVSLIILALDNDAERPRDVASS